MVVIDDGCYDFMFYKERYVMFEYEYIKFVKISNNFFIVY